MLDLGVLICLESHWECGSAASYAVGGRTNSVDIAAAVDAMALCGGVSTHSAIRPQEQRFFQIISSTRCAQRLHPIISHTHTPRHYVRADARCVRRSGFHIRLRSVRGNCTAWAGARRSCVGNAQISVVWVSCLTAKVRFDGLMSLCRSTAALRHPASDASSRQEKHNCAQRQTRSAPIRQGRRPVMARVCSA